MLSRAQAAWPRANRENMNIPNAIRRAIEGLARPAIPIVQRSSRAGSSRVAVDAQPVSRLEATRPGTVFKPCVLTVEDRRDVFDLYRCLTDKTMSEVRGSRCAFLSGLSGETREEADRWMVTQFDQFFSHGDSLGGACIGLRDMSGKLIGISFMKGVSRGVCRTWGLTIRDDWHGMGAGTALKREQLRYAREELGFIVAQTVLDLSDMKGIQAAEREGQKIPIVKLLERVSRQGGYRMFGPEHWDRESMVISMKLEAAR
jgi:hypothetical protein